MPSVPIDRTRRDYLEPTDYLVDFTVGKEKRQVQIRGNSVIRCQEDAEKFVVANTKGAVIVPVAAPISLAPAVVEPPATAAPIEPKV